jgi:hypothetical protein
MNKYDVGTTIGLAPYIRELGTDLVGCEIGVWEATNLAFMLQNILEIKTLYAVDPWQGYLDWDADVPQEVLNWIKPIAMGKIADFPNRVQVVEKNSVDALIDIPQLDFIFIDGDHSYAAVLADLRMYYSRVRSGGIFSGHDWSLPEVNRALMQFRAENDLAGDPELCATDVWFWYKP